MKRFELWLFLLLVSASYQLKAQGSIALPGGTHQSANKILQKASIQEGTYFIKVLPGGKYLGIQNASKDNGAKLLQWDYSDLSHYKIIIKHQGNQQYTLQMQHSQRFLNVAGASNDNNALILQWDYDAAPNLLFSFIESSTPQQYFIRCEGSGKYWHLHGGNHQSSNGLGIVQFEGQGAVFQLEAEVNLKPNKDDKVVVSSAISGVIEKNRSTTDNHQLRSKYQVAPPLHEKVKDAAPGRRIAPQAGKKNAPPSDDPNCDTKLIKVTLSDDSFMTSDIAAQVSEIIPGSVFHIEEFLKGSWKRQEDQLKPITLSTDVKHVQNKVYKTIQEPVKHQLKQGISELFREMPTQADMQSNLQFSAYMTEVHNEADFQMQIGAGGHYLAYSLESLFNFEKNSKKSYFLIDITKVLFTIEAHPPQDGFFNEPTLNNDPNLVYLRKADYGMRILASVETTALRESIAAAFKLSVNALVASGNVSLDVNDSEFSSNTTIKMFVVGGNSRDVVPAYGIADLKQKVLQMAQNLRYQNCQPIRYTIATTKDNWVVSYQTSTDEFVKQTCTPPALKSLNWKLTLGKPVFQAPTRDGDLEVYGKIWAHVYAGDGAEIPAVREHNMLLEIPGNQFVDLEEPNASIRSGAEIAYHISAQQMKGAYVIVYFALFEHDGNNPDFGTDGDGHFTFQYLDNTKACETGASSKRWCWKKIYLEEISSSLNLTEDFKESDEGASIQLSTLYIAKTPQQP